MVGSPSKPFARRLEDLSVLATLLLFTGGVSAQADDIFTVRIENVSAKDALKLSNGKTEPVGVAPVLYVVHTNRAPLFTSGEPDRGKGLEALAKLEASATGEVPGLHGGRGDAQALLGAQSDRMAPLRSGSAQRCPLFGLSFRTDGHPARDCRSRQSTWVGREPMTFWVWVLHRLPHNSETTACCSSGR
jgi:hypothetical protein